MTWLQAIIIFPALKRHLTGNKFKDDSKLQISMARWTMTKDRDFYQQGIKKNYRPTTWKNASNVGVNMGQSNGQQSHYRAGQTLRVPEG